MLANNWFPEIGDSLVKFLYKVLLLHRSVCHETMTLKQPKYLLDRPRKWHGFLHKKNVKNWPISPALRARNFVIPNQADLVGSWTQERCTTKKRTNCELSLLSRTCRTSTQEHKDKKAKQKLADPGGPCTQKKSRRQKTVCPTNPTWQIRLTKKTREMRLKSICWNLLWARNYVSRLRPT